MLVRQSLRDVHYNIYKTGKQRVSKLKYIFRLLIAYSILKVKRVTWLQPVEVWMLCGTAYYQMAASEAIISSSKSRPKHRAACYSGRPMVPLNEASDNRTF